MTDVYGRQRLLAYNCETLALEARSWDRSGEILQMIGGRGVVSRPC